MLNLYFYKNITYYEIQNDQSFYYKIWFKDKTHTQNGNPSNNS